MKDTADRIMAAALRLFARDGYEAVSVSAIASELGLAKSALYKHYKDKRAIFDGIVARMESDDAGRAAAFSVPTHAFAETPEEYRDTTLESFGNYALAQFDYWTAEEFSALFRRLLTVEQYRSEASARMYAQYMGSGPVDYIADVFKAMRGLPEGWDARVLAVDFWGPLQLLMGIYDEAKNGAETRALAKRHIESFFKEHFNYEQ